jgi:predicted permease
MRQWLYFFKEAWHNLKPKPGLIAIVTSTMGLTLGALLCASTLVVLLLVSPLPYPEQDKLYRVLSHFNDKNGGVNVETFTYPGLIHLNKNQDVFEQTALMRYSQEVLTSSDTQPKVNTSYVTPEWFQLLGARAHIGRHFDSQEGIDRFNPAAVLSYRTWQQEYDGALDVLDKSLSINGVNYQIIGVLRKDFIDPQIKQTKGDTSVWLPWDFNPDTPIKDNWGRTGRHLTMIGKLKSGLSPSLAAKTLTPLSFDTWKEQVAAIPVFDGWSSTIELKSFASDILGENTLAVYLLLAGALGLSIIAFTNITNLLVSQAASQQKNLAIRTSLGAKNSDIFKLLIAESSILMLLSAGFALVICGVGFYVLQKYLTEVLPRINELKISWLTISLAFFIAISLAWLLAFTSQQFIRYKALSSRLQSGGKGTNIQVSKRVRQALIMGQVFVATSLIFATTSLFKESVDIISTPFDLETDNRIYISLSNATPKQLNEEEAIAEISELRTLLEHMPQIETTTQSDSPLGAFHTITLVEMTSGDNYTPSFRNIDPGYFDFFNQRLIEGNSISDEDMLRDNVIHIVINDVFAQKLAPNSSAIGMKLSPGGEHAFTVVGIVKGVRMPNEHDIPIRAFLPTGKDSLNFTLKLKQHQSVSRETLIRQLKSRQSTYALFEYTPLTRNKKRLLSAQYTTAITSATLALLTLFLSSIGLYGILSFSTQMLRAEVGTRLAVGAKRKDIILMVLKDNSMTIALGIGSSLVVSIVLAARFDYLTSSLIVVFTATVISICSLSLFACYWPLRQFINRPVMYALRGNN